ncbi:hypothetical protein DV736_g2200, partial [Chaetothyriales sp. CBS 134916]
MSSNSNQIQEVVDMEEKIDVFSADGRSLPMTALKNWNRPRCAITAESVRDLGYDTSLKPIFLQWTRCTKPRVIDDVEFDIVDNAEYPIVLGGEFCKKKLDENSNPEEEICYAHAHGGPRDMRDIPDSPRNLGQSIASYEMADSNSEAFGDARLEANGPGDENAVVPFSLKGMSSYALGLVLLLFVVLLWTTSSFLGSSIFADGTYAKPFFLTYLNTSTFILAATPNFLGAAWRNRKSKEWKAQLAWIRERYYRGGWRLVFTDEKDDEKDGVPEGEHLLSHALVSSTPTDLDDEEGLRISNSATFSPPHTTRRPTSQRQYLAILPTAKIALQFCPLWFSSNYLASACLQHTSVASATILTSTSSIWTLAIGALSGTEKFTLPKFLSVIASLLGIILISSVDLNTSADNDDTAASSSASASTSATASAIHTIIERTFSSFPTKSSREIILGDAMALCSALVYGCYTVFLKRTSTAALPLKINMSLLFGLIGIINTFLLAPLLPLLSALNIEPFQLPPTPRIWVIALVNSTASLVGDISWAHALLLTSPLVVTVGLSLTIPVSLVGEMFLQGRFESMVYWLGSLFVVGSFVFVAREEARDPASSEVDEHGLRPSDRPAPSPS